jgi:hypothetical protein
MALNHLATRFTCSWPWRTLVLLCDGRTVCGCADPHGRRVLGDTRQTSVHDIWTGDVASRLRADLNRGGSIFSGDCPLKLPLAQGQAPPERNLDVPAQPSRLYIECTAACNISCLQACCARAHRRVHAVAGPAARRPPRPHDQGPHAIEGGQQADVPIEIPAPASPGRYHLTFDLVCEGIDWFEACGSPTTTIPLRIW